MHEENHHHARHVASKAAHVTAVDVSQAMLDKLASKTELAGKVDGVCQNILERPLDKQFDLIVSAMAMHHVEDTDLLMLRFAEHLKPGGQVALADLDVEDGDFHPANTEGVFHAGSIATRWAMRWSTTASRTCVSSTRRL